MTCDSEPATILAAELRIEAGGMPEIGTAEDRTQGWADTDRRAVLAVACAVAPV